jgi:hypothetical protein
MPGSTAFGHGPTAILLAVACTCAACGGARNPSAPSSAAVIDQAYVPTTVGIGNIVGSPSGAVQSFTVGITGSLVGADLLANGGLAGADGCANAALVVEVHSMTAAGTPGTTILTTGSIPGTLVPQRASGQFYPTVDDLFGDFKHIEFSSRLPVTAGEKLAMFVGTSNPCAELWGFGLAVVPSDYIRGSAYVLPRWMAGPSCHGKIGTSVPT